MCLGTRAGKCSRQKAMRRLYPPCAPDVGPQRVHCFPHIRIGHTEDGGFHDGGVLVEDFFDLGTVAFSPPEIVISLARSTRTRSPGHHATEIPRCDTSHAEGIDSLFGVVPNSPAYIGAAHDNLASRPTAVRGHWVDDSDTTPATAWPHERARSLSTSRSS